MHPNSLDQTDDANHIILNDDYIEARWNGPQNAAIVHQSNLEAIHAAEVLRSKNKPILVYLYISNMQSIPDMGAYNEAINIFNAIKIDRIAITGNISSIAKTLIESSVSSLEHEYEISYIEDPKVALEWLLAYKKQPQT